MIVLACVIGVTGLVFLGRAYLTWRSIDNMEYEAEVYINLMRRRASRSFLTSVTAISVAVGLGIAA